DRGGRSLARPARGGAGPRGAGAGGAALGPVGRARRGRRAARAPCPTRVPQRARRCDVTTLDAAERRVRQRFLEDGGGDDPAAQLAVLLAEEAPLLSGAELTERAEALA